MSHLATAPRLIVFRHGETEWSLSGKHTSHTDISLTPNGVKRIQLAAHALIGPDRLINTNTLAYVYHSPMARATETMKLLNIPGITPIVAPQLCEWDYGDYEGTTTKEIRAKIPNWELWRDGCPNGDSPESMTQRIDEFVRMVRAQHRENWQHPGGRRDILVVAHGHSLRSLAARWLDEPVSFGKHLLLDAGGCGVLSYEHSKIDEPALDVWNVTDGKGIGPTISRPTAGGYYECLP